MAAPSRPAGALFRNLARSSRRSLAIPLPANRIVAATTTTSRTPRWHSTSSSSSSSVNPDEVSHFNALAADWWDPHGSSRLLHLMNPLRHDFIRECQRNDPGAPTRDLKILDIGCGGGIFAESAARLPTTRHVTAIDPTPKSSL
ncbi:hypothetical protein NXS19_005147 [Fusarium pseudograminearum]|nr:hypothetical protein NXS19_005147 [Fusarium pseudograminearum]